MDQKERRKLLGILLINGVFYIQRVKKRKKRRTRRSCLMKEWFIKRDSLSAFNTIFKELHLNDQEYFRQYLRTNTEVCELMLSTIRTKITKQTTKFRIPISP